jgi:MFS family permease
VGPGYVLSGFALAYLLSRTLLGFLPEDFGRRFLMVLPGVIGGGTMLAGILSRNYLLTAGAYVLGGFFWSWEYPAILSNAAHERPERFGATMAFFQLLASGAAFLALNAMGAAISRIPEEIIWKVMLVPACGFPCVSIGAGIWLLTGGRTLAGIGGTDQE